MADTDQFEQAITAAANNVRDAENRYNAAVEYLNAHADPGDQAYEAAQSQARTAATALTTARDRHIDALQARATASARTDPATAERTRLEIEKLREANRIAVQERAEREANQAAGKGYKTNDEVQATPKPSGERRQVIDARGNTVIQESDGRGGWATVEDRGPSRPEDRPAEAGTRETMIDGRGHTVVREADGRGGWRVVEDQGAARPEGQVEAQGTKRGPLVVGSSRVMQEADGHGGWNITEVLGPADPSAAPDPKGTRRGPIIVGGRRYTQEADGRGGWNNVEDHGAVTSPTEDLTPGGRAVDNETARNAPALAAAALQEAKAKADLALTNYLIAQRQYDQSPSNEESKKARDAALRTMELQNQSLEAAITRAEQLAPLERESMQASIDSARESVKRSQQQTEQAQQGPLYGVRERIATIAQLRRDNKITVEEADQMADELVQAAVAGSTPFDMRQADATAASRRTHPAITQRGQDTSLAGQKAGTYAGMVNSAQSTFSDLNNRVAVGSDAAGKAFLAARAMAMQDMEKFQAPSKVQPEQIAPMLRPHMGGLAGAQGMIGGAPPQAPPPMAPPAPEPVPPSPPPQAAPTPGINITINGQPASPQATSFQPSAPPPLSAVPPTGMTGGVPSTGSLAPAMPQGTQPGGVNFLDAKRHPETMDEAKANIAAAYGSGGAPTVRPRQPAFA